MSTLEPCNALLLCAEDGAADTIKPRLEAAGAVCARIHVFQDGGHSEFPDLLHRHIIDYGPALVVIDPLAAYLGRMDVSSDHHMRRLFTILTAIAGLTGVTFLLVHHQSKRSGGSAMARCAGSIAIAAASRSVMVVARDPENESSTTLAHVKGNLSARSAPLRFHLEDSGAQPKIVWDGIAEGIATESLLAAHMEPDGAMTAATAFLQEVLEPGPMPSRELEELALAQGFKKGTYDRARLLVAHASRVGGAGSDGAWMSSLKSRVALQDGKIA